MADKRNRLEFAVHPLWKFLQDTYGMEQAFLLFGPYQGASIFPRIVDDHTVEVRMPLVMSNTNYVGAQFGGSLYAMADPFFMFILMWNLGPDYIVWDKGAQIEFRQPGRGEVHARFHIPESEIERVRGVVAEQRKTVETYAADVLSEDGQVVAHVRKDLYVRAMRKPDG